MKKIYIILSVLTLLVGLTVVFFIIKFIYYDGSFADREQMPLFNCDGSKLAPKDCRGLVMVTRSEWVAQPATGYIGDMTATAQTVLLSYTQADDSCNSTASCKLFVRNLQHNEITELHYTDIRYSFLIDAGGRFYDGRGWTKLPQIDRNFQIPANTYYLGLMGDPTDSDSRIVQYRAVQIFARTGIRAGNLRSDFDYFCSDEALNRSFTKSRDQEPII